MYDQPYNPPTQIHHLNNTPTPTPLPIQPSRVAAAEAAFNALLARIAAGAEEARFSKSTTTNGSNSNGPHIEEEGLENVATAMARLLGADAAAAAALPPPLLRWNVHRFEGWVGGVLKGIAASEVGGRVQPSAVRGGLGSSPHTPTGCTETPSNTHKQADSFYGHEGGHATRDFMPVGASGCEPGAV